MFTSPPNAWISQLKTTPVLIVGFVFVTCVITCTPAEHRFVRGKNYRLDPLLGFQPSIPFLQMFYADWCHLVIRSFSREEAGTQLTHTSAGPGEGVDG